MRRSGGHGCIRSRPRVDEARARGSGWWRGSSAALEAGLDHGGASIDDYLDARGRAGLDAGRVPGPHPRGRAVPATPEEHRPSPPPVIQRIVVAGRSTYFCPNCQERLRRRPRRKPKRRARAGRGRGERAAAPAGRVRRRALVGSGGRDGLHRGDPAARDSRAASACTAAARGRARPTRCGRWRTPRRRTRS